MKNKLLGVSLFCGCGGLDLGVIGGFEYLGKKYEYNPVEIVYANDNDSRVCELYNENFSHQCKLGDINEIKEEDIPPHHIIFGGFPCQSFSILAQNPPRLGYADEKGKLVFEMIRIIKYRKPLVFIAENVKGILSANKGKAFPLIIKAFQDVGYSVTYDLLNSSDYGIPQKRERVFIIGFRDPRIFKNFKFPEKITETNKIPLSSVLINEDEIDDKYYFSQRAIDGLDRANRKRGDLDKGRVQSLSDPSNTVTSHLAKVSLSSFDPVLKINGRYRMYTPREVARIQSFPDDYKLAGSKTSLYRALGNAVPPVLMWHITQSIITAINKTDQKIYQKKPFRTKDEIRSYNMSKIRSKDTKIEKIIRSALWSRGYRYRIHPENIIGKPDIVFTKKKLAIFCDSSFWHGRQYKNDTDRIKTNQDYWKEKIKKNIERDNKVNEKLESEGWTVLRFWDDEIINETEKVITNIISHL